MKSQTDHPTSVQGQRPAKAIAEERLGDLLVREGLISQDQLNEALRLQRSIQGRRPLGQILVDQRAITQKQLNYLLQLYDKRPRLGEILVKSRVITAGQLESALDAQRQTGMRLGSVLIQLGYTTDEVIRQAICTQLNIPFVDLDNLILDRTLTRLINQNYAKKHLVIPLARIGESLTLAADDPTAIQVLEEIQGFSGLLVNVVTSTRDKLDRAFIRLYSEESIGGPEVGGRLELITESAPKEVKRPSYGGEAQEARADAVVRKLIGMALDQRASDIHLETLDTRIHTRFRIDGVLQHLQVESLEEVLNRSGRAVISRLKVLGNLDIAERRRPQDGSFRARMQKDGQVLTVDLRISIVPSYYGESVVLRLLDRRNAPGSIQHLGFSAEVTERLRQLLQRQSGIILITGPTGSGKSSTLYGALMTVFRPGIKIVTVEDPIEYVYEQFAQCEVNERIGNTFASYLRSFLRHDPEVIMVGEIRDAETAELAFRAAQTGHLVLSTMHTNDAVSSLIRLQDLGIDPSLIASSLIGALSQRLVRQVCQDCKEEYLPAPDVLKEFFGSPMAVRWYRGKGCSRCNLKGFKGRMPVAELWSPGDNEILLINKGAQFAEVMAAARQSTITMAEDVADKLRDGHTNLEELIRMLPYRSVYQFRELPPSRLREAQGASNEDAKPGPLQHPDVKAAAGIA